MQKSVKTEVLHRDSVDLELLADYLNSIPLEEAFTIVTFLRGEVWEVPLNLESLDKTEFRIEQGYYDKPDIITLSVTRAETEKEEYNRLAEEAFDKRSKLNSAKRALVKAQENLERLENDNTRVS